MKAALLIFFLFASSAAPFAAELLKVKTPSGAILKEAPDGNAPQVGARIPFGATVEKLGEAHRYYRVKTSGTLEGWSFKGNFEATAGISISGGPMTKQRLMLKTNLLQIIVVDVEVGDATLFICPADNGARDIILIDTGEKDDSRRIFAELKKFAPLDGKPITRFIATHYDSDHIGDIAKVAPLAQVIYDHGTNNMDNYYKAAVAGKDRRKMELTYTEQFSGGVRFECVAVNQATDFKYQKPSKPDDNPNSIALIISLGDFDYFTGGDLTKTAEASLAAGIKNCDVYHVNHHGSVRTSSSKDFVDKLDPEVSIASNGRSHGHPSKKIGEMLSKDGRLFFHTNRNPDRRAFPSDPRFVGDFDLAANEENEDGKGTIRIFIDPEAGEYYLATEREEVWTFPIEQ